MISRFRYEKKKESDRIFSSLKKVKKETERENDWIYLYKAINSRIELSKMDRLD